MIRLTQFVYLTALLFLSVEVWGASAAVKGVRLWEAPDSTRVVFDLNRPVDYQIFELSSPRRLVIDFEQKNMSLNLGNLAAGTSAVKSVRVGKSAKPNVTRVVLDLARAIKPNSFTLPPYKQYGDRLVVDLFEVGERAEQNKVALKTLASKNRDIIIAIDPGHGGEDPGAVGPNGTLEKDITFGIAKKLKKMIDDEPGMRAILTREGDYFLRLRKRQEVARKARADLFVSIHADSFPDARAKGSSVWIVSNKGARSEVGRWLEARESSSEKLGGVEPINDKDPVLAELLLELSMDYSVGESYGIANSVLKQMKGVVHKIHRKTVQEAAFVVLKAPDITSLLIEAAFISNPKEEKLIRSKSYQRKLAKAIKKGIKNYYRKVPPEGTLYADLARGKILKHKIVPGDTLSEIALRFGTTVAAIKAKNSLPSDLLTVGQVISIPL